MRWLALLLIAPFGVLADTMSPDADYGFDVDDGGTKYVDDGTDYFGRDGGTNYRIAMRFDITSLPATATVDDVDLQVNVSQVLSAPATATLGPYNADGTGNPQSDSGSTAYTRCDVSSDNYIAASEDFRSTGSKTFDLGATADSDVEAARDAGTTFSVCLKSDTESGSNNFGTLQEYTGADPPTLTITYTPAGGGPSGHIWFYLRQ